MGKMKEVSEGLNDMYTVVVDIISSVARVADMVAPSVVTKNLVTKIDLDQLRVVLSKGLKDIATLLLMDEVHEPKKCTFRVYRPK